MAARGSQSSAPDDTETVTAPASKKKAPPMSLESEFKRMKAENARLLVQAAQHAADPETKLMKAMGLKRPLPPITAGTFKLPDPTEITDGDGEPVGTPGYHQVHVPHTDMHGRAGESTISRWRAIGYEPVRYREGEQQGEVVDCPLGLRMEAPPEQAAAYVIATHPTHGVDAAAHFRAQLSELRAKQAGGIDHVPETSRQWHSHDPEG